MTAYSMDVLPQQIEEDFDSQFVVLQEMKVEDCSRAAKKHRYRQWIYKRYEENSSEIWRQF